jgi:hypothetical protein
MNSEAANFAPAVQMFRLSPHIVRLTPTAGWTGIHD